MCPACFPSHTYDGAGRQTDEGVGGGDEAAEETGFGAAADDSRSACCSAARLATMVAGSPSWTRTSSFTCAHVRLVCPGRLGKALPRRKPSARRHFPSC
jgi:hypothetical protein